MSNTVKVTAPDDINSASHAGQTYARGEDGFFHMPQEAAVALAPMGFTLEGSDASGPDAESTSGTSTASDPSAPLAPTLTNAGVNYTPEQQTILADPHATQEQREAVFEEARAAAAAAAQGNENPDPAPAPATDPAPAPAPEPEAPAAPAGEDTPSPSPAPAGDENDSLLGCEGLPDGYALEGGDILPAKEVVAAAFKRTGASLEEWNALAEADRASLIKSVVDELPLAKVVDPALDTLVNEGGKTAPQTPEGSEGGDGVSAAPAAA